MKNVEELIGQLPPEYQRELEDFAEFLLQRSKGRRRKGELKLNWRGGLKKSETNLLQLHSSTKPGTGGPSNLSS